MFGTLVSVCDHPNLAEIACLYAIRPCDNVTDSRFL